MVGELKHSLETYKQQWQTLVQSRQNQAFFASLQPTALGWKVADRDELVQRCMELRDLCDQIHFGWVNERWLVTLHFKDAVLPWNVQVLKLMERRPGSTDAVGLDHIDFYAKDAKQILQQEPDLKWDEEKNGEHCKWLSIWFEGTEAKLRSDTVLQVCADELLDIQKEILPA